jgi:putative DNA primase/helicase
MTVADLDSEIKARGGAAAVAARGRQAASREWAPLDKLPEPRLESPALFPFDAMGQTLGLAALAISNDVQAPDSLAAGSVLAAASLAAQPHADVVLPHGQRAPLSLFVVTGCGSGDRKTAVDAVALHSVEEVRKAQARAYLAECAVAEGEKDAQKPTARSLTIGKATTEGLQHMLKGQSTIGLFSSEGAEMLAGHSMREERRSAGLAWLLKAWGGETLDALTRGDGLSMLLGRRVAMHVLVQPVVLRQLLSDPLAQGQGLLARCLIAQPDSLAGTRTYRDCNPLEARAVVTLHRALDHLLQQRPPLRHDGDACELQPRPLPLSTAARALWIEFYNEIEQQQAPGCELEHARAFASKAAEHAARIGAIVELMADPMSSSVSAESIDGGMRVAEFYLGEHLRLTGAGTVERRIGLLQTLANWMRERGKVVPHRDVLQRAPNPVRVLRADGIAPLLAELSERNYIRKAGDVWEVRDA